MKQPGNKQIENIHLAESVAYGEKHYRDIAAETRAQAVSLRGLRHFAVRRRIAREADVYDHLAEKDGQTAREVFAKRETILDIDRVVFQGRINELAGKLVPGYDTKSGAWPNSSNEDKPFITWSGDDESGSRKVQFHTIDHLDESIWYNTYLTLEDGLEPQVLSSVSVAEQLPSGDYVEKETIPLVPVYNSNYMINVALLQVEQQLHTQLSAELER